MKECARMPLATAMLTGRTAVTGSTSAGRGKAAPRPVVTAVSIKDIM